MEFKAAKWIFIIGTSISAMILLGLTIDTHRQVTALTHADQLTPQVIAGKAVWEKYNCNDCHTILGFGGYYAPDMTKAYWRLGAEGIKVRVLGPDKVFANSMRKMPKYDLTEEEVKNLIAFLKWVSEIENNNWPPQDQKYKPGVNILVAGVGMSKGAALIKEAGCLACHSLGGVGGLQGPEFEQVKRDKDYIKNYILDPRSINPDATMPAQRVSEEEAEAIAEYIANLKEGRK